MPRYEMALILKVLERPDMINAIKRTAEVILEKNGILRSFENLGQRRLPFRMYTHGTRYYNGSYFLMEFDCPTSALPVLRDHLKRDLDIIHPGILRAEEEVERPCLRAPCDFGEMDEEKRLKCNRDIAQSIRKL